MLDNFGTLEELVSGRTALSLGDSKLIDRIQDHAPAAGFGFSPDDLRTMAGGFEKTGTALTLGGMFAPQSPHKAVAITTGTVALLVAQFLRQQAEEEERRRLAQLAEAERQRKYHEMWAEHRDFRDRINGGRDLGQTSRNDWDRFRGHA